MAELRSDNVAERVESGAVNIGDGPVIDVPTSRTRNVILDERQQPLQTATPIAATASPVNRSSDRAAEADAATAAALFPADELARFRQQWDQVQVSFVDDPEQAVQQADNLVTGVVKRIADQFAEQRSRLEQQWRTKDEAATTEELRRSLRQYRVFFDRLLSL